MELPGTSYLYTIATLSITYAGFAALIVIFRQIIGGGVSNYDIFVIRSVLMRSFIDRFFRNAAAGVSAFRFVSIRHLAHLQLVYGSAAGLVYSNISSKTTRSNTPSHK